MSLFDTTRRTTSATTMIVAGAATTIVPAEQQQGGGGSTRGDPAMHVIIKRNLLMDEIQNHYEKARRLDRNVVRLRLLASRKQQEIDRKQQKLADAEAKTAVATAGEQKRKQQLKDQIKTLKQEHTKLSRQVQGASEEARKVHILQRQVSLQLKQLDKHEEMIRFTRRSHTIQQRVDQKSNQLAQEKQKLSSHNNATGFFRSRFLQHRRLQALEDEVTKLSLEADRFLNQAIRSHSEEERIRLKRLRLLGGSSSSSETPHEGVGVNDSYDGYSTDLEDDDYDD